MTHLAFSSKLPHGVDSITQAQPSTKVVMLFRHSFFPLEQFGDQQVNHFHFLHICSWQIFLKWLNPGIREPMIWKPKPDNTYHVFMFTKVSPLQTLSSSIVDPLRALQIFKNKGLGWPSSFENGNIPSLPFNFALLWGHQDAFFCDCYRC